MGKAHNSLPPHEQIKSIHPKSRKAKQLSKKRTRDAKMVKKKAFTNMKLQVLGEKLAWFKENLDSSLHCYTVEQIEDLIMQYIDRNSEEMEVINFKQNIGHRKSRQHASREDLIRICRKTELSEFLSSGLETVDLSDKENLEKFKEWSGEIRFISNLKMKRFIKTKKESMANEETTNSIKENTKIANDLPENLTSITINDCDENMTVDES